MNRLAKATPEGSPSLVLSGCAVVRNRSKHVMREAARSCGFPVAGYDIILFATPKTRVSSPQEMDKALRSLMKRAGVAGEER